MKTIKEKVVVITGAGKGIGCALAVLFSKRGAKLALNSRTLKNFNRNIVIICYNYVGTYYQKAF